MDEESAVNDHLAVPIERSLPAMTMMEDLKRDWRRWSVVERTCAAALTGLWASGITTAMLVYAHVL
jgi:hypothetical protein